MTLEQKFYLIKLAGMFVWLLVCTIFTVVIFKKIKEDYSGLGIGIIDLAWLIIFIVATIDAAYMIYNNWIYF